MSSFDPAKSPPPAADEAVSEPTWDGAVPTPADSKPTPVQIRHSATNSGASAPEITRIGPFEIGAKLGQGGMGVVYRAVDTRLGRPVALKVLDAAVSYNPQRRQRFLREARAAAAAHHRNIATVFEVGEAGDELYLAMEIVGGGSLRQLVRPGGLPAERLLELAEQLAAGLAAAHAVGVVHRDLKPDNLLLHTDGELRILDFGLAFAQAESDAAQGPEPITRQGQILGTPGYMSPEQAMGQPVDARADVFAAGALLYELAAGRLAWPGKSAMELVVAVVRDEPVPLGQLRPDLPPKVLQLISACMQRDAAQRPRDGGDLLARVKAIRQLALVAGPASSPNLPATEVAPPSLAAAAPAATVAVQAKRAGAGRSAIRAVAAAVAVAALATGAWWWARPPASMRDLPAVGGGAAGQAAFGRAVQAYYDMDFRGAAAHLDAAMQAGANDPVVAVLAAGVKSAVSTDTPALPEYDRARAAVEGKSDPAAATVRCVAGYTAKAGAGPQQAEADLANSLAAIGDSYLLQTMCLTVAPRQVFEQARQHIDALLRRDDRPMLLHVTRVGYLMLTGRNAEALAAVDALLAQGRVHPELLGMRGMALMGLGRAEEGRQAFEQQLALDPNAANARSGLLEMAMNSDDDAALRRHQDALLSPTATRGMAGPTLGLHALRMCARGRLGEVLKTHQAFGGELGPRDEAAAIAQLDSDACAYLFALPAAVQQYRKWLAFIGENPRVSAGNKVLARDSLLLQEIVTGIAQLPPPAQLDSLQRRLDSAVQEGAFSKMWQYLAQGLLLHMRGDSKGLAQHAAALPVAAPGRYTEMRARLFQGILRRLAGELPAARANFAGLVSEQAACAAETEDVNQMCRGVVAVALGQLVQMSREDGDAATAELRTSELKKWWPRADADLVGWLVSDAWRNPPPAYQVLPNPATPAAR